jgi:hypothetical protein
LLLIREKTNVTRPAGDLWPLLMRNRMRIFAVLIAISALSQPAIAQTPECKSISAPNDRLACYDKAAPRVKSTGRPAAPKPDPSRYVDAISAEDALMNARLKNICRGC